MSIKHNFVLWYGIPLLFLVAVICYSVIGLYRTNARTSTLAARVSTLEGALASTTESLRQTIASSQMYINDQLHLQQQNVGTIKQQLGTYQQQVGTVSNTVETLQKLSKTDPQLLQKYSKVFFLNEYYAPARLAEIPDQFKFIATRVLKIHTDVLPRLKDMLTAADADQVKIYVQSAYRSFNEQQALKGVYTITYGAGTANQFSADQGYSEHQLGTALDFITSGLGGQLEGFDDTKAFTWLMQNAYRYGFILSYPKNNKFYVFEPWHWRYVGVKLATYLHDNNMNFYDMDQRKIDEYLINVFE